MQFLVSLTVLFFIEVAAYILFSYIGTNGDIIAASLTGIAIVGGYFITHYLELLRRDDERKYQQYSDFLKSLRFLILEINLMGSKQQEALRDDLQNATFQAALLIDDKTYTKFKEMMEQFAKLLGIKEKTEQLEGRNIFVEKQKVFVNALRKDYRSLPEIDFSTWDFRLPEHK